MSDSTSDLVITRTFQAPRELVWKAWTSRDALAEWWGPKGSKLTVNRFDLEPGGLFLYYVTSDHGSMWGRFRFAEVTPPERLVFTNSFSNERGRGRPGAVLR